MSEAVRVASHGEGNFWGPDWAKAFARSAKPTITEYSTDDPLFLLRVMSDCWRGTFDRQLPRGTRNLVFTLRDKRNEWAHNRQIRLHDALYTLSGIVTLVKAVDTSKAEPVRAMPDGTVLTTDLHDCRALAAYARNVRVVAA